MTIPRMSDLHLSNRYLFSRLVHLRSRVTSTLSRLQAGLDQATYQQRQAVAITSSTLLHLVLLLLLLPPRADQSASMGTLTGLGVVNGIGTTVTLIDESELMPSQATQTETQNTQTEQPNPPVAQMTLDASEDSAEEAERKAASSEAEAITTATRAITPDSSTSFDTVADAAAGAFGHDGQSNLDLWNAIAPCWNRLAGNSTLPATLKITFDADGGLATPPEIERAPDAPITDRSLKSEAQALQALAECGAYPMAKSRQGVTVKFPPPASQPVAN